MSNYYYSICFTCACIYIASEKRDHSHELTKSLNNWLFVFSSSFSLCAFFLPSSPSLCTKTKQQKNASKTMNNLLIRGRCMCSCLYFLICRDVCYFNNRSFFVLFSLALFCLVCFGINKYRYPCIKASGVLRTIPETSKNSTWWLWWWYK